MKNIGKPYTGKPYVRFDEGGLAKGSMDWLLRHRQTKGAETDRPIPTETGACPLLYPFTFMENKEIIELLRNEKQNLQEKFGLISIGLFGSQVKGTDGTESDVDLLVELSEARFDSLAGLQIYLETKLRKPVDLIRKRESMSSRFLSRIEKDILYV